MTDKLILTTPHLRGQDGSRILTIRLKDKLIEDIENIVLKQGY